MPSLNNRTTTDSYEDATLNAPNSTSFTVQVSNAAITYQISPRRTGVSSLPGGESWEPPEGVFLLPGYWNFTANDFGGAPTANGLRCASAVSGVPAQVTISA
jgi:hypothetical protein